MAPILYISPPPSLGAGSATAYMPALLFLNEFNECFNNLVRFI